MKVLDFYNIVVLPTVTGMLHKVAPAIVDNEASRILLMTICGQESDWMARRQNGGPARSYWQFEKSGGVVELFSIPSTAAVLDQVCGLLDIPYNQTDVFEAMAWNDTLACTMGRLLIWQDPAPVPAVDDVEGAWQYYLRNWRPGAPRRSAWDGYYAQAKTAVNAVPSS